MASRAWRRGQCVWRIAAPFDGAEQLGRQLRTSTLVGQLLHNRGIDDATAAGTFLNPKLTDLSDPALLNGACEAARLIAAAVRDKKRIVIYGDYDVDGITAVAILHACLKMVGGDVHYYVPHRLDEGYGVNAEAVAKIVAEGCGLLITVDCGISAAEPLGAAVAAGLTVIVTDHHNLPRELPQVHATVHPAMGEGAFRDLSGAGVAFKLAWQVAREICGQNKVDAPMREFLLNATCLAALGTIADVVPLLGENRVLATFGLSGLPQTRHAGMRALLDCSGLTGEKLDAYHVGFMLAPRINACGRMGHAGLAIELMTDAPEDRCIKIAQYLAQQNTERQRVEREITTQAIDRVIAEGMDQPGHPVIVLADEAWHGGVIGIVASRLVDRFNRPAILMAIGSDAQAQGSGRSIPGLHLCQAMEACSAHLTSFGGHAMAGGLRMPKEKIDDFRRAMLEYCVAHISPEQMQDVLAIDAETTLAELSLGAVEHMNRLAPFGQGNPSPVVAIRQCELLSPPRRMGRSGQTIGMMLRQNGSTMRAVGFGMGDLADSLAGITRVDIAAEPTMNTFNGRTSIELRLVDVQWE